MASTWAIFTVLPFNKAQNNVFAKSYTNFINITPGLQPAQSLIIGENSVVNAVSSPIFVSDRNLGAILAESQDTSSGQGNSIIKYTVQKGETLSEIADKFNISVETILLTNELTNSKIVPGQELMILPIDGVMHMVEKGDTVKSIAATYKVDASDIIKFNSLSEGGDIYTGDVLIIPGGKMPKAQKATVKDVTDSDTGQSSQVTLPGSYFMVPTKGKLTQGAHFSYVSSGKSYYTAVDIANDIGTPVLAAAGGEVQIAKNAWPYGNYITIAHPNGVITLYAHLSGFAKGIVSGTAVTQGQTIGYMGNSGHVVSLGSGGSHLHFETRGTTNPLTKYRSGTQVSY
jgi:murein DD-endopeptidase MepM/ murein hydrolase activator NlpD